MNRKSQCHRLVATMLVATGTLNGCAVSSYEKCQLLRAQQESGNSVETAALYVGTALIVNELAPECRFGIPSDTDPR